MNFDDLIDDSASKKPYTQQPIQVPGTQGLNPSLPPDQFLGQVLDKASIASGFGMNKTEGDEIEPSMNSFDSLQDDSEKYGTGEQLAKTFAEGAGRGASFGLSTGLETATGVNPEDITNRKETNPLTSMAGEMVGLGASALIPVLGEANLLAKAGETAVLATGLANGVGLASKIGSKAVQLAVETALYQGGDEISKMLAKDPHQTAQTAMADIGLAAVLGGGFGTILGGVSPLWKAASGSKLGTTLKTISDRMGGIEGVGIENIDDALAKSGMNLSPEQKALMSNDPGLREMGQELGQTATRTGTKIRKAEHDFHYQSQEQIADALGKTVKDVNKLSDLSDFESGDAIKKSLMTSIKEMVTPVSQSFDKIKNSYSKASISDLDKQSIMDSVLRMSNEHGYDLSPSAPQSKLIGRVLDELPNLKTAQDLRKYSSVIADTIKDPEMYRVGGQLRTILRNAEEGIIEKTLGVEAPELLDVHAAARSDYKKIMDTLDALNERVHVGKYSGPDSFISSLKEMAPEDVLRRLANKNDAGMLAELTTKFPTVADAIKSYHVDKILKAASDKAMPGQILKADTVFSQLEKLSPELKAFVLDPQASAKLDAIRTIIDQMPKRLGPDTARLMDSMGGALPGALGAVLGAANGHAGMGSILGYLGKSVLREGTDAAKFAFLKFMSAGKAVDAEGFKQMSDMIHATMKGEAALNKASKNLFKAGAEVLPSHALPTEGDRLKIDKSLRLIAQNPEELIQKSAKSAHYMPAESAAMITAAMGALNMIQSGKPGQTKAAPLDSDPTVTKAEKAAYNNLLNLAQQPMLIMHKAKDGTLTMNDVNVVKTMYPDLYRSMVSKVTAEVINAQTKKQLIPYKTRMGLSLLLGSPVDSTFSPGSILAAQPLPTQAPEQQGSAPASKTNKLSKMPTNYSTVNQTHSARMQKQ